MPKYSDRFLKYLIDQKARIKVPNDHDAMSLGYLFDSPDEAMSKLIKIQRSTKVLDASKIRKIKSDLKNAYGSYKQNATPWPSGMSYSADSLIPLPGFASYAQTAGGNRAGNAIPCRESSNWLFDRNMAPNFPLVKRTRSPPKSSFGTQGRDNIRLLRGVSQKFYDHRGPTGFSNLPTSIYKEGGGNVPYYSNDVYAAKSLGQFKYRYNQPSLGSALPRPYGPRDNAAIKGYPALPPPPNNNNNSSFGESQPLEYGPFMNQGYPYTDFTTHRYGSRRGRACAASSRQSILPCIEGFNDYGPFINKAYFGDSLFRPSSAQFDGRQVMQRNPIQNLYLSGYSPFDLSNKQIQTRNKRIRQISQTYFNNRMGKYQKRKERYHKRSIPKRTLNKTHFGHLYDSPGFIGPNDVGYSNPFLMYPGAGGNTRNYLTGMNYYPPCDGQAGIRSRLKVRPNTNPNGFLSGPDVVPVTGLGFGDSPPWVAKGQQLGRPYPTQFNSSTSDGSGFVRLGQPLELYTYQNTDYGNRQYPEFLGPRAWYGGFGNSAEGSSSTSSSERGSGSRSHRSHHSSSSHRSENLRLGDIQEGDIIHMRKNGNLAIQKHQPRRHRHRKYYY